MIDKLVLRKYLPYFSDEALLNAIAMNGELVHINAGELIMEPGKYIKVIPIILYGSIKVLRPDEKDKEVLLYYLEKGDTCAMSLTCCNAYQPSEVKAIAEEDTDMINVPVILHEEWQIKFRQWKEFVARTYLKRFNELLKTVDEIAFKKMDERLLVYLHRKMNQGKLTEIQTTHHEIGKDLGTSREVISRLLKQLENEGHLVLGRNKIKMKNNKMATD
ncbi:MAG TPA: Crp/Fnr family transcriptional regulator [Saprospiraceae bacterium]|nr:Crp/Fnr family transcriptional regulator [Saprospiraceae bacterium]